MKTGIFLGIAAAIAIVVVLAISQIIPPPSELSPVEQELEYIPIEPEIESVDEKGLQEFGELDDEHIHAEIYVVIFGERFDFTHSAYQYTSKWIHIEGGESSLIHRHASGVTLGYFFDSLNIQLTEECFTYDNGKFCTNDDFVLRIFLNGIPAGNLDYYIVNEGDRIVVYYGTENIQLDELPSI